ncbi:Acetyltransferase [Gracilaria domingensis]|nr:Acetyltransferase [Gracilaria domingensis]
MGNESDATPTLIPMPPSRDAGAGRRAVAPATRATLQYRSGILFCMREPLTSTHVCHVLPVEWLWPSQITENHDAVDLPHSMLMKDFARHGAGLPSSSQYSPRTMGIAAPMKKTLPPELELRVQQADDALLAQIVIELVKIDTDWNWSAVTFDLVEQPIMAFTVHDRDRNQLVASALLAAPVRNSTTSWVGFVVVASSVRRCGVATCLMRALIEHACARDDVQRVELLATNEGAKVYESVGFDTASDVNVCLMRCDTSAHRSFEIVHDVDILTNVPHDLREAVAELCDSVAGNRRKAVQTLFVHGICLLDRHADGTIQAVSWIRRVQNKSVETWWLGPLVSHHIGATESIIQAATWYAQQHSKTAQSAVEALSFNCSRTFERQHFANIGSVPLMRRETPLRGAVLERGDSARGERAAQYVALCDYHAG